MYTDVCVVQMVLKNQVALLIIYNKHDQHFRFAKPITTASVVLFISEHILLLYN